MLRYLLPLLAIVIVTGCQTAPSGPVAPLDYSFDADRMRTKEAIIATFLPRGYQIVRDSEFQLVLDRPANDNFGAQLIYGSRFNVVPNARVMLTFLGDKPTKVHAQLFIVTNPGSGFESPADISNNPDGRASIARGMEMAKALVADGR